MSVLTEIQEDLDNIKALQGVQFRVEVESTYFQNLLNDIILTESQCHHHDHIQLTETTARGGPGGEQTAGHIQPPG